MSANDRQVGGDHYKIGTMEHWDVCECQGVGYLESCASKYVARYRSKAGRLDLEKALHYVEKTIEMFRGGRRNRVHTIDRPMAVKWFVSAKMNELQERICSCLFYWESEVELQHAAQNIQALIAMEYPA
jgi:hypothetical protein